MKIVLQPHLKIRLKQREIPPDYPSQIFSQPDNQYLDTLSNHQIAVKKLKYNGKLRPMAIAYDIIKYEIQIITVYPVTDQEISNRIKRRRWIRYEKN